MRGNGRFQYSRNSLGFVLTISASLVLAYLLSVVFQMAVAVIFTLFSLALTATLWMNYRILKDPYSTEKSFDDYFYQDRDDLHRNGTEEIALHVSIDAK